MDSEMTPGGEVINDQHLTDFEVVSDKHSKMRISKDIVSIQRTGVTPDGEVINDEHLTEFDVVSDKHSKIRISKDIVSIQCTGDTLVQKLHVYQSKGQFCDIKILVPEKPPKKTKEETTPEKSEVNDYGVGNIPKTKATISGQDGEGSNVLKKLSDYYEICAHTCVISAGSELFYSILTDPVMNQSKDKKIIIDSIYSEQLQQCISYLYGDTVVFYKHEVDDLLSAAVKLKIKSLENHCRLLQTLMKEGSSVMTDLIESVFSEGNEEENPTPDSVTESKVNIVDDPNKVPHFQSPSEGNGIQPKTSTQNLWQKVGLKASSLSLTGSNEVQKDKQISTELVSNEKQLSMSGATSKALSKHQVEKNENKQEIVKSGAQNKQEIVKSGAQNKQEIVKSGAQNKQEIVKSGAQNKQEIVKSGAQNKQEILIVKSGAQDYATQPVCIVEETVVLSTGKHKVLKITPKPGVPTDIKQGTSQELTNQNDDLSHVLDHDNGDYLSDNDSESDNVNCTSIKDLHYTNKDAPKTAVGNSTSLFTNLSKSNAAGKDTSSSLNKVSADENNELVKIMQNNVLISQETMLKQAPLKVDNMDFSKINPKAAALLQALGNSILKAQSKCDTNVVPNTQYYLSIPPEQLASVFAVPLNIPVLPVVTPLPQGSLVLLPPQNNFGNSGISANLNITTNPFPPIKPLDNSCLNDNSSSRSASPVPCDMTDNVENECQNPSSELSKIRKAYPTDFVTSRRKRINKIIVPEDSAGRALFHHSYAFESVERKSRDIESAHTKLKPKRFPNLNERKAHYKFQNLLPKECDHCGEVFPSDKACRRHMQEVRGLYKYCQYCSFKTVHPNNLRMHEKRHRKEKPFKCNWCDFRAVTRPEITFHQVVHTKRKDYVCELCGKEFTRIQSFRVHRLREHGLGKRRRGQPICYQCDHCDFRHPNFSTMKSHKLSHSNLRLHRCTVCGRSYKRKSQLRRHRRDIHKIKEPKNTYSLVKCGNDDVVSGNKENNESEQSDDNEQIDSKSEALDKNYAPNNTKAGAQQDISTAETYVPMNINFIPVDEYDYESDEADETSAIVENIVEINTNPQTHASPEQPITGRSSYADSNETKSSNSVIRYTFGQSFVKPDSHETTDVLYTRPVKSSSKSFADSESSHVIYQQQNGVEVRDTRTIDLVECNELNNSDYESMYWNLQYGNQQQEVVEVRGTNLDPNDHVIIDSLEQIEVMEAAQHLDIMNSYSITI